MEIIGDLTRYHEAEAAYTQAIILNRRSQMVRRISSAIGKEWSCSTVDIGRNLRARELRAISPPVWRMGGHLWNPVSSSCSEEGYDMTL